jgi:hypothetical protein
MSLKNVTISIKDCFSPVHQWKDANSRKTHG